MVSVIEFVDRKDEIKLLEKDWGSSENAFVVVYGRRRIGKTRLIEEFLKDKKGIKYTAGDTNKKIQIKEFKDIIAAYLNDEFLKDQEISDWTSLFSYLSKILDKERKFYIWIDEFSYLIKNDSSITSTLHKFIDDFLRKSKIFFVVSGSIFGLMSEKILAHSSPLYGRRTRDLLLKPIPSLDSKQFLKMNFEDSFKAILTLNGIPEYLLVASKFKDYSDFIKTEFVNKEGYFYREPYFLLSQEFKEIKTYFSILNAIAYGNTRPSEIANFVGIDTREIYPYLELLISYGFIKRETSIFGDKKRGIYFINDNFFDFWFNFVHKKRELIEKDLNSFNNGEVSAFLGKRFEIFIRENFSLFFKNFEEHGRYWNKQEEIDIAAFNQEKREILFAECKWGDKVNAMQIINQLVEKAKYVEWNNKNRKESFAVFAKSFSKKIKEFEGKKVYCFDLKDLSKKINSG